MDKDTLLQIMVHLRSIQSNAQGGTLALRKYDTHEEADDPYAVQDAQDYFARITDLVEEALGQWWAPEE